MDSGDVAIIATRPRREETPWESREKVCGVDVVHINKDEQSLNDYHKKTGYWHVYHACDDEMTGSDMLHISGNYKVVKIVPFNTGAVFMDLPAIEDVFAKV